MVCVVGTPLDFRLRYGRFGKGKLIHVHGDPRELGRNRVPDAALVGDCAAVLGALADGVERPAGDRTTWLDRLRSVESEWWDSHRAEIESDAAPIHHYRLGAELDRVLDEDTVVVGDGGDVVAACRACCASTAGHWLDLALGPATRSACTRPVSGSASCA